MEAATDLSWDDSLVSGLDWSLLTAELARDVSLVLVLIMLAMLSTIVVMALKPGRRYAPAEAMLSPLSGEARALVLSGVAEARQAVASKAAAASDPSARVQLATDRDTLRLTRELEDSLIFSASDALALVALRRRIERGEVADGPTARQRLEFVRWLSEHGQLGD